MIEQFWDQSNGGFYFTSNNHEALIARTKEYFDNATPSGNSVAADILNKLSALLNRPDYREKSEQICKGVGDYIRQFPSGMGRMLSAIDFIVGPSREIALIGPAAKLLSTVRNSYLPRSVIAYGDSDEMSLLHGRQLINGEGTAYVCENYLCKKPTTQASVLEAQLLQE